jgi:hypothetical protein
MTDPKTLSMQFAQDPPKKQFYLLFREVRCILEVYHSGNASVVKIFKRTFGPTNLEFTSSDEIESYFEDSPMWTTATKKSQPCKPSTFQNRVRIPCFLTWRTQRTISRRVRHGELCSKQRYRPLQSNTQEAEVSRLGFCRFIRPIYSLCFTVFKLPAEF